ncbi:B-type cyclin [Emydomyces testavorans]|uniref:B-type cyclin n=1 Tax=Emydomyces testavorans TaxID=2070801 RepID=A0AAF0DP13_9EURO|nr:B-type cyclin [Emydomyces testavorans]
MDAKPQRPKTMRIRGDENVPVLNRNGKTLHQRNKSSPALSTLAAAGGSKDPSKRTALGNVSNTANILRLTKDDDFTSNVKENKKLVEKPSALGRPAQRASQATATKVSTDNVTTDFKTALSRTTALDKLPVNTRKPPVRRNTAFQESALPPLVELMSSVGNENLPLTKTKPISNISQVNSSPKVMNSNASHDREEMGPSIHAKEKPVHNGTLSLPKAEGIYIEDNGEIKIYNPSGPVHSISAISSIDRQADLLPALGTERTKENSICGTTPNLPTEGGMAPYSHHDAAFDPEESWDDGDENYVDDGYHTACSQLCNENAAQEAITTLFPDFNMNVQRELAIAKQIVESTRKHEDYEDECDDPTMVAEYGDEIFEYMEKLEIKLLPNPHYMENQAEIQWSMRSVLMDWIVHVHLRFSLLPETLFLCVNYIDRFLSCKIVSLGKLQLVGATAIFIAAKYEEINCPSVQEIVYMVDNGYTVEEILKAERFMLSLLQFELGWPGPMNFLRRISKADEYDLETRTLAKYFLEITIMDERFVGSPPSFLAAGAHCLARMMLRKGDWTAAHIYYSNYTYSQLYPLISLMLDCCDAPKRHHPAIYEKYSDRRFKRASYFVEGEVMSGFQIPHAPRVRSANRLISVHNRVSAVRRL